MYRCATWIENRSHALRGLRCAFYREQLELVDAKAASLLELVPGLFGLGIRANQGVGSGLPEVAVDTQFLGYPSDFGNCFDHGPAQGNGLLETVFALELRS